MNKSNTKDIEFEKPIVIHRDPFSSHKAVERHLRKYGHLPTTDLCDEQGSCMGIPKRLLSHCDTRTATEVEMCRGPSYSKNDKRLVEEEQQRDYDKYRRRDG